MFTRIINTKKSSALLILRIALGTVMLAHGLQKAFGLFNGFGWENTIHYFTDTVGLPGFFAAFIILIESLGAFLLMLGFAGRINAALMGLVITGALVIDHAQYGFYMNWFGVQKGEDIEFDILFIAMSAALVLNGSGSFSIDRFILKYGGAGKIKDVQNTLYRKSGVPG